MKKVKALIGIVALFFSCQSEVVFSDSISLNNSWNYENTAEFELPQLDTLKKYNLFLNIRNTNDYPYNNIFLIVSMNFPHGKTITDTLEYRMAHPDGTWMGHGFGKIKENKLWYKEQVSFSEPGTYRVHINHAMRNNGSVQGVSELKGIVDVGFNIEEAAN